MTTVSAGSPTSLARRAAARRGDVVFAGLTRGAGVLVLVILAAIAVFLVAKAVPALRADRANFFTTEAWNPDGRVFGIAALAFGSIFSSALALLMAVPVALAVALFTTEYAPRRLSTWIGYVTDLLAAVPSVVYGLWGLYFLLPRMVKLQEFLAVHLGFLPFFDDPRGLAARFSKSVFGAAVILAIMILPIIAAISREVLRQVDPDQREAALALGATRWEMVRTAVLPPSRAGILSAAMLGLGRALGETIAVALVIGNAFAIDWRILVPGGNTVAANIAVRFGEADELGRSALIASGLVLFVLTLAVNLVARGVIYRSGRRERSVMA